MSAVLPGWSNAAAGSALALFRFKVGVIPLLGACAAAGLAVTLLLPLLR